MNDADYRRVERAIAFLDRRVTDQPRLDEVARHVGLSPFHFSRLFRRWAGLPPKRFLQVLTVRRARSSLDRSPSLLQASLDVGLSGPGRLHDLTVTLHAMTPAELRHGGAGLRIRYGFHTTPFGDALAAATDRGVCWMAFVDDRRRALDELRRAWPGAAFLERPGATRDRIRRAFADRDAGPLHVCGTNFQVRIWEALLRIAPGETAVYGDLAPGARAAGSAVARNRIACLIPCHRVIRATGVIGTYRWGSGRKRALLAWEAARAGVTAP